MSAEDGRIAAGSDPDQAEAQLAYVERLATGTLSDLLGIEVTACAAGRVAARLPLRPALMGPGGYVHAGTVVSLADTCAGIGCVASFPPHAQGFTTMELKANLIRAVRAEAVLLCQARILHGGRTTQVWDAEVTRQSDDALIGAFRCTQLLLGERRI